MTTKLPRRIRWLGRTGAVEPHVRAGKKARGRNVPRVGERGSNFGHGTEQVGTR